MQKRISRGPFRLEAIITLDIPVIEAQSNLLDIAHTGKERCMYWRVTLVSPQVLLHKAPTSLACQVECFESISLLPVCVGGRRLFDSLDLLMLTRVEDVCVKVVRLSLSLSRDV